MGREPTSQTAALAGVGVAAVLVLAIASLAGEAREPTGWLAAGAIAVAVLLVSIRETAHGFVLAGAALAIVASGLATYTDGHAVARGIAIAAAPCALALAGIAVTPSRRTGVLVTAIGGLVAGPVRSVFFDPFLDGDCQGCRHSALAVVGHPVVAFALAMIGGTAILTGLVLLATRSAHTLAACAVAVFALLSMPPLGVEPASAAVLATAAAIAACVASAISRLRMRGRLSELARAPRTADALVNALRQVFRDPTIRVFFSAAGGWLTPTGGRASIPIGSDFTELQLYGGGTVRIDHAVEKDVAGALGEGLPPQLMLSLEEQRLTAYLEYQLRELRESRARIVRRADDERRRLERDLHDGAQQHVLALGMELRAALTARPTSVPREVLERCLAMTMQALDELREIAHGVYPPLLSLSGLVSAVRTIPGVAVGELEIKDRMAHSVERMSFLVIAEFADRSKARVEVSGARHGEVLELHIVGEAVEPTQLTRERVAALGGTLESKAGTWSLELPCA